MKRTPIPFSFVIVLSAVCSGQMPDDARSDVGAETLRQQCLHLLRDALISNEFWPAVHAAEALTQAGEEDVVLAALRPRLANETNDPHRCGIARELVRAGDKTPVKMMLSVLRNTKSNGRIHAAESLFKVGETGDGTLLRSALDEGDPVLELMAAAALIRGGDKSVFSRVRCRLASDEARPRQIAAWVLGQLGDESDRSALEDARKKERDPVRESFIVNALARLGSADALVEVERNLDHENPIVRRYAAETVGACGVRRALGRLTGLLRDPDLDTRVRAAQAILVILRPDKL